MRAIVFVSILTVSILMGLAIMFDAPDSLANLIIGASIIVSGVVFAPMAASADRPTDRWQYDR